jgi:LPXTG-site transpeptidase (sortase) family protein
MIAKSGTIYTYKSPSKSPPKVEVSTPQKPIVTPSRLPRPMPFGAKRLSPVPSGTGRQPFSLNRPQKFTGPLPEAVVKLQEEATQNPQPTTHHQQPDSISVSYDATSLAGLLHPVAESFDEVTIFEGDSEAPVNVAPPVTETPIATHKPTLEEVKKTREAKLGTARSSFFTKRVIGAALVVIALIGGTIPILPKATLEAKYQLSKIQDTKIKNEQAHLPLSVPLVFTPLVGPDGQKITPVNTDFSLIIPKLGINSPVISGVDPFVAKDYTAALEIGVAQSKTSYLPDQDGAVYLFSHSTNYAWYVKDMNAVFYQIKDLEPGDKVILFYKGKQYTYQFINKTVTSPADTTYLLPITGKKMLILQTCWPPGSTTERLLIFADLVEDPGINI